MVPITKLKPSGDERAAIVVVVALPAPPRPLARSHPPEGAEAVDVATQSAQRRCKRHGYHLCSEDRRPRPRARARPSLRSELPSDAQRVVELGAHVGPDLRAADTSPRRTSRPPAQWGSVGTSRRRGGAVCRAKSPFRAASPPEALYPQQARVDMKVDASGPGALHPGMESTSDVYVAPYEPPRRYDRRAVAPPAGRAYLCLALSQSDRSRCTTP